MNFFIGIVPPKYLYDTILNIQQQFGDNRLEPHITLRPPIALTDETAWVEQVQAVARSFPPFTIHLPKTGNFGKRVLFIDVVSKELYQLYDQLLPSIKPFEKPAREEDRNYHPHLTLGRKWCGFTPEHFKQMKILTDEFLSEQPISFTMQYIRIYHKSGSKRYQTLRDIPLATI